MNIMQWLEPDLPYGIVPAAMGPALRWRDFLLVFTYICQEDIAKISKVPRAPRNVNSVRAMTWLGGVTIYFNIFE